jgi:hypothetical protein
MQQARSTSQMALAHLIEGIAIPVGVSDEGLFVAELDGEEYESGTFRGLKWMLEKAMLARRFEVLFVSVWGRKGVMRGYHAGNHDVLVTWSDGTKDRISQHDKVFAADEVSDEDIAEIQSLLEQTKAIDLKIAAFHERATHKSADLLSREVGTDLTEHNPDASRY